MSKQPEHIVPHIRDTQKTLTENQSSEQTSFVELIAAQGAGRKIFITDMIISNGAVAGNIQFLENTSTVKISPLYFSAWGGAVINFKVPFELSANVNFGYISNDVTNHSIILNYYVE